MLGAVVRARWLCDGMYGDVEALYDGVRKSQMAVTHSWDDQRRSRRAHNRLTLSVRVGTKGLHGLTIVHTIVGGSSFGPTYDYASTQAASSVSLRESFASLHRTRMSRR